VSPRRVPPIAARADVPAPGRAAPSWCAAVVVAGVLTTAAACGDPPLQGTFTSRVVQLDSCRVLGDADEGCEKDEQFAELRVDLVAVDDNTWWLYGVPRAGVAAGALLGTRDTADGMLFVDELEQRNAATGCVLRQRTELSLRVDPARVAEVGDPCVALVGRQVDTTTSSAECDTGGVPPQAVRRIVRRRWEPLDVATTCGQ
jgi:hypothetical protein